MRKGIKEILPPKKQQRPLPSLLYTSFFYGADYTARPYSLNELRNIVKTKRNKTDFKLSINQVFYIRFNLDGLKILLSPVCTLQNG